jgi:hypothetical protein
MLQDNWRQFSPRIRRNVNNNNCIEQIVGFLHQIGTVILVLLDSLDDDIRFAVIRKFNDPSYLKAFQERLDCGTNRRQQGHVEITGKCFQSIRSYVQTCCNAFQSGVRGSRLGGHLVGG